MFTGKAAYPQDSASSSVPEGTEDLSDMVALLSPYETPLLDMLGDPLRKAGHARHEWRTDTIGKEIWYYNTFVPFTASLEVRRDDVTVGQDTLADEVEYQKQEKLRVLLRELENAVINGQPANGGPEAMKGILSFLTTNVFRPGDANFPAGNELNEAQINYVSQKTWLNSNSYVDLIVVGGFQKRRMNQLFGPSFRNVYDSDFGSCEVVVTRWMPDDAVLFLDSSKIDVVPRTGHSFHYKLLARSPHFQHGQLSGEYTLELRNEVAHGLIRGLKSE